MSPALSHIEFKRQVNDKCEIKTPDDLILDNFCLCREGGAKLLLRTPNWLNKFGLVEEQAGHEVELIALGAGSNTRRTVAIQEHFLLRTRTKVIKDWKSEDISELKEAYVSDGRTHRLDGRATQTNDRLHQWCLQIIILESVSVGAGNEANIEWIDRRHTRLSLDELRIIVL
jgi:hypothetical protein